MTRGHPHPRPSPRRAIREQNTLRATAVRPIVMTRIGQMSEALDPKLEVAPDDGELEQVIGTPRSSFAAEVDSLTIIALQNRLVGDFMSGGCGDD
jgi:hypothetical protein